MNACELKRGTKHSAIYLHQNHHQADLKEPADWKKKNIKMVGKIREGTLMIARESVSFGSAGSKINIPTKFTCFSTQQR